MKALCTFGQRSSFKSFGNGNGPMFGSKQKICASYVTYMYMVVNR